jgi:hypothetical protein
VSRAVCGVWETVATPGAWVARPAAAAAGYDMLFAFSGVAAQAHTVHESAAVPAYPVVRVALPALAHDAARAATYSNPEGGA